MLIDRFNRTVSPRPLRVVVAHPAAIFRAALAALVKSSAGLDVVASVATDELGAAAVRSLGGEVVLFAPEAGPEPAHALDRAEALARSSGAVVVVIDGRGARPREAAPNVVALSPDAPPETLLDTLRAVAAGADRGSDRAMAEPSEEGSAVEAPPAAPLSPREREVATLVASGRASKEIALALGISRKTVEGHRSAIMHKLGIRSIAGVVRYAIARGFVRADG